MFFYRLLPIFFASVFFSGCIYFSDHAPDVSHVKVNLHIKKLENELFACQSQSEVKDFLQQHSYLNKYYFSDFTDNDSLLIEQLYNNVTNESLREFRRQLETELSSEQYNLEKELKSSFQRVKYYFPDFQEPKVKTIITGFLGNDLYISDTLIIIGIDYFGGPGVAYRPNVYDYQLARYQKENIVPAILFFIADRYNSTNPEDKTLLNEMIGYGKSFEFVKYMTPYTPDSLIIGYSQETMNKCYYAQTDIWGYLVSNKLLYQTSQFQKQKYIGERPFTLEMGPEVPGGIGRWVGWRIVSRYMDKNSDMSLPELMRLSNSQKLLEKSGYKGQVED